MKTFLHLCAAQKKVEDKSNEITTIPKVLETFYIEDAVVSIDAPENLSTLRKFV